MRFRCSTCNREYPFDSGAYRCACGGWLDLVSSHKVPEIGSPENGIWRWRAALGLPERIIPVCLGEGDTPLMRHTVDGTPLFVKLDYLQPSGSFKDRGATVLVSYARAIGVSRIVEDSSGNAGAAMAAYATAANIACTIYVPEAVAPGKLVQMRAAGARVVRVPGDRSAAHRAVQAVATHEFYASHLWHPLFPLGTASAAFELWQQLGGNLPDVVVVPCGGGSLVEGLFLGFQSLAQSGAVASIPKIIAVQTQACRPVHAALTGAAPASPDEPCGDTIADGITVAAPPRLAAVLRAVRESSGRSVVVSDEQVTRALAWLLSSGYFVEPTAAVALAGWQAMPYEEREGAVVFVTGHGLKQTAKLASLLQEPEGERHE